MRRIAFTIVALLAASDKIFAADVPPIPYDQLPAEVAALKTKVAEHDRQIAELKAKNLPLRAANGCKGDPPCTCVVCKCSGGPNDFDCGCIGRRLIRETRESANASTKPRELPKFYSTPSCIHCPPLEAVVKEAAAYEKLAAPDWMTVPRVEWEGYYVEGNNPTAVLALLRGDPSMATPIKTVAARQPITSSGPSWTWPGNLRSHLSGGHGFSEEQLAGLSQSELIALHDNSHNGSSASRSVSASRGASARMFRGPRLFSRRMFGGGGGCPGGSCP